MEQPTTDLLAGLQRNEIQEIASSPQSVSREVESPPTTVQAHRDEMQRSDHGQSKEPVILTEFTCFKKMPLELREIVWRLSIRPRFIKLWGVRDGNRWRAQTDDGDVVPVTDWRGQTDAKDVVPVTSRVCHESRKVFLKEYRLYIPANAERGICPIYASPLIDTIYLHMDTEYVHPDDGMIEDLSSHIFGFRDFLNERIETEPMETRIGSWRQKWEIKNLALPIQVLVVGTTGSDFCDERERTVSMLSTFREVDNIVFIGECEQSPNLLPIGIEARATVAIPETDEELLWWEHYMGFLGRFDAEDSGIRQDYSEWSTWKLSIAVFRWEPHTGRGIPDRRKGLALFGPRGVHNPLG